MFPKTIKLPGDKSLSHRALIMSALSRGISEFENLSPSADVTSTKNCLIDLGVNIDSHQDKTYVCGVGPKGLKAPTKPLDCGNSGTTMRLLMGVLAAQEFECVLIGDESLSQRPMKRVAEPLRLMGARIELTNDNYAPIKIKPSDLHALTYDLPVASSQVKSALMLAAMISHQDLLLGGKLSSRDHTERLMPFFHGPVKWKIPSDISAASFWITAGLLAQAQVRLEDVLLNPTRMGFVNLLKYLGADIETLVKESDPEIMGDLIVRPSRLKPIWVEPDDVPFMIDEIPLLALLATQVTGSSQIRGAEELKFKESNRIEKTAAVLRQLGAQVQVLEDGFIIEGPQKLKGGVVETFGDHRLTMMAAVAGYASDEKVKILDPQSASVSDPFFFDNWKKSEGVV